MISNELPPEVVEHLSKTDASVGFYIQSLTHQQEWLYGNRKFLAASTIKLPILAAYFEACRAGLVSEEESYFFSPDELIEDSPILDQIIVSKELSMRELLEAMIILSDNTATNIMINFLGMPYIQGWLRNNGFVETQLNRVMMDLEARAKGIDNWTTPLEMGRFMTLLATKKFNCEKYCNEMISILTGTQDLEKIPYLFDNSVEISNKPGELVGNRSDVAILRNDTHEMVMSIFCDGVKNDEKTDLWIAELAFLFWNLSVS